ncbi:uncharacterized protein LOC111585092 isoform X3 [Amphiprion ocellaris]|uniref:uncharacterized protein LOC111585092 isoform X3 n=1 Tax=Amphiprion ocellaris TaxID=80972 RepID=UPI00241182F1|nr:uncharacterized protein LOC111585092 isoform X3 [Amphiprion ocellaris]
MPKKYAYPPETLQILESLWTQGMQNCSTDENKLKIQQASVATGLVDERIKSWIYSRNRKKKRDDEGQSKAKKSCSTASNARISTEASQDQPSVGTCPSSQEHTSEYLGGEKCLNWTAYPQGFLEDVTQNQDRTEEADSECSRQGQEGPSQDSSSSDEYVNRTTETDPSVQDSDKDSQQGAAASLIQVVEGKVCQRSGAACV